MNRTEVAKVPTLPRHCIVALAGELLEQCVISMLKRYSNLSATAVSWAKESAHIAGVIRETTLVLSKLSTF